MKRKGARITLISLLLAACPIVAWAQETRFDTLNARVMQLYREGKYADAIPLAQDALRDAEATLGPEHSKTAVALNNLAELYREQGQLQDDAEPLYRRALAIREKVLGPEHPDVAASLNNLALMYVDEAKYRDAEPLYKRALAILEKALAPEHPYVATTLDNLAELYRARGQYAEAEPLYTRALDITEKTLGPEHPDLAITLNHLALLYRAQARYANAESVYKRALAIKEKVLGPEHPGVAVTLANLAGLYRAQDHYADAEPLYNRALAIEEKALGPEHPELAITLNNVALLYREQGRYGAAESLYKRALAITEKTLGPEHPNLAGLLDNLALLYQTQGKYRDAEALHKQALAITEKALGPEHADVATSLNNLASLYQDQGKYADAELLYERALAIREKVLGPEHPDVANSLNNLAVLYQDQSEYADAEPLYERALAIREKALGSDHQAVATTLDNLAVLYQTQGKYRDAEPLHTRALAINEKVLGPEHLNVAIIAGHLADLYRAQAQYGAAEPLYKRALAITEKALGPEHPDVASTLNNLALVYLAERRYPLAGPLLDRSLQLRRDWMTYQFSYMSEKDRLAFLDTIDGFLPRLSSFVVTDVQQDSSLAARLYDQVLLAKGAVAQSVTSLNAKVAASGDTAALRLFKLVTERKREALRLSAAPSGDVDAWRKTVDRVRQEADDLQAQLARRIPATSTDASLHATWQQVYARLNPGEAAVEFVRFQFYDGKNWTATSYYAALILTADASQGPTFALLGDAKDLECGALNDYSRIADRYGPYPCKQPQPDGSVIAPTKPTFYDAFWKPLEAALGNAKRIYVAPDGILNQVSFAIVPDDRGTLLLEKYDDLRMVLSTRDLLRPTRAPRENNAVLIGNPLFDLDQPARISAARTVARNHQRSGDSENTPTAASFGIDALRGTPFDPLDSTEKEITGVSALLQKQRWQTQSYTGTNAIVEVARQVHHPRVLHIATHGAFAPDPKPVARTTLSTDHPVLLDDPMLRSALFFTGANRFRRGVAPPPGLDDGVLTAYEATGLDLDGTELVVLSACETGLGSTQTGEGVFGLRRAFQEAGAEALLVSMWKVPDDATQELMQLFYTKWLGGEEKPRALRAAQLELRETIRKRTGTDDPHLWGGFVLIGR